MSQCEVFQPGFKIMTWFTLFWTSQGLLIRERLCFDLILFSRFLVLIVIVIFSHGWHDVSPPLIHVTPVPSSAAHNNGPNHSSPGGGVILTDWLISQHWALLSILLDVRYESDQSETLHRDRAELQKTFMQEWCSRRVISWASCFSLFVYCLQITSINVECYWIILHCSPSVIQ